MMVFVLLACHNNIGKYIYEDSNSIIHLKSDCKSIAKDKCGSGVIRISFNNISFSDIEKCCKDCVDDESYEKLRHKCDCRYKLDKCLGEFSATMDDIRVNKNFEKAILYFPELKPYGKELLVNYYNVNKDLEQINDSYSKMVDCNVFEKDKLFLVKIYSENRSFFNDLGDYNSFEKKIKDPIAKKHFYDSLKKYRIIDSNYEEFQKLVSE